MEQNIRTKAIWMHPGSADIACVVGNVAVAVATGGHILFVNLKTAAKSYYLADSVQSGNGVACLAGHKLFPILAFAERCTNPRILLISYPANTVLSVLEGDQTECSYIALCFSESELLVALTGVPDYSLEVYAWRSKELLCKKPSSIICDLQRLICSPSAVFAVCQYAPRKPELKLWEVHGNIRLSRLIERTVCLDLESHELPLCVTFLIDGNLAVVTQQAKVFTILASTGQISQTISSPDVVVDERSYIPFIFYCKGGLFVSAPDGQVNFYKKQKGTWNQLWSTQSDASYSQLLHYSTSEGLLGITTEGFIMRTVMDVDVRNVEFHVVKDLDVGFTFSGTYTINSSHKIVGIKPNVGAVKLLNFETGAVIDSINVGHVECTAKHLDKPYLVVGSNTGILQLIVVDEKQIKLVGRLHLSRHSIVGTVCAIADDRYFAALDAKGQIAIIEITEDLEMIVRQVFGDLKSAKNLFLWCSSEEVLMVQPIEEPTDTVSFRSVEFIVKQHHTEDISKTLLSLPHDYCQIVPKRTGTRLEFYAHQIRTNVIDLLEISRTEAELEIVLLKTIKTPLSVAHVEVAVDERFLYVWSMDGKTALYECSTDKLICTLSFDSRFNGGIKQISLDRNN
uniref:Cilia- and flagella-associated protein 43 n=1 Tax=Anopheles maculatus TaxID=74869 RepID=A0A182S7L7_9DIPT